VKDAPVAVLVVDDEAAIRQILVRSISSAGFAVAQAVDGLDALKKLEQFHADIVISDLQMPNMDGLQLLKEIRARFAGIGVILITGHRKLIPGDDICKAGADDLISKPFHNHEIVAKLKQYLQNHPRRRPDQNPEPSV
jgi:DNA-binding response OmpR family regulator